MSIIIVYIYENILYNCNIFLIKLFCYMIILWFKFLETYSIKFAYLNLEYLLLLLLVILKYVWPIVYNL